MAVYFTNETNDCYKLFGIKSLLFKNFCLFIGIKISTGYWEERGPRFSFLSRQKAGFTNSIKKSVNFIKFAPCLTLPTFYDLLKVYFKWALLLQLAKVIDNTFILGDIHVLLIDFQQHFLA